MKKHTGKKVPGKIVRYVAKDNYIDDETGESYGSFEVFEENACSNRGIIYRSGTGKWYWWACFPGCLSNGDLIGPFDSEQQATTDATGAEQ